MINESPIAAREIYCCDIKFTETIDNLPLSKQEEHDVIGGLIRANIPIAGSEEADVPKMKIIDSKVNEMFGIDYDFLNVKSQRKEAFENNFRSFYQSYKKGDWNTAMMFVSACRDVPTYAEDGPCIALSDYIERFHRVAPDDWIGYRNIDEKDAEPSLSFMNNDENEGDEETENEGQDDDSDA